MKTQRHGGTERVLALLPHPASTAGEPVKVQRLPSGHREDTISRPNVDAVVVSELPPESVSFSEDGGA